MSDSPILQTVNTTITHTTSVIQNQAVTYNLGSIHQATAATKTENKATENKVAENKAGNRNLSHSYPKKEGVLLDGKFIEVKWPEGINENDEVTIKVTSNNPELKVTIVNTPNQKQISQPTQNKEQQHIEALIKQIKQSSEHVINYKLNEGDLNSFANIKNNIILQLAGSKIDNEEIVNFLNSQNKLTSQDIKESLNIIKNLFENKKNLTENLKDLLHKISNSQNNEQKLLQLSDNNLNYYSDNLSLKNDRLINILKANLEPLGLAKQSLVDLKTKIENSNISLPSNLKYLLNNIEKTISNKPEIKVNLTKALELSNHFLKEINNHESIKFLKPQLLALNAHLQNAQAEASQPVATYNSAVDNHELENVNNNQLLKELIQSTKSNSSKLKINDLLLKSIENNYKTTTEIKDILSLIERGTNLDLIKNSLIELTEWTKKNATLPISAQILSFAENNLAEFNKLLGLGIRDKEALVLKILNNIHSDSLKFLEKLDSTNLHNDKEQKNLATILNKLLGITESTLESLKESHYELLDNIGESLNKDLSQIIKELAKLSKESIRADNKEFNILINKLTKQIENIQNQIIKEPTKENITKALNEFKSTLLLDLDKINNLNFESKNIKDLIINLQKILTNTQLSTNFLNPELALDNILSELEDSALGAYLGAQYSKINAPSKINKALLTLENILKTNWDSSTKVTTNKTHQEISELIKSLATIKNLSINLDDQQFSSIINIINHNSQDLQQITKQNEQVQQTFINKLNNQLKKVLDKIITPQNTLNDNQMLKALNGVENILKGQEALQQMAPILQATGEPIFLMFPMLMQGFMSKVELQHYGHSPIDIDPNKNNNKKNNNDHFQRTDLSLTLEGLGNIKVELAYNSKQIFCNFRMEDKVAIKHIEELLPLLNTAFSKLGYKDIESKSSILERNNKTVTYKTKSSLVIA